MERTRPQMLVPQRDSDAQKEIEASRASAFSRLSVLELRTGSKVVDHFEGSYVPRVLNLTFPWLVGGPDLEGVERFRLSEEAPVLTLDDFTRMLPRRAEAQIRWDWDLVPAVWSLAFATKVTALNRRRTPTAWTVVSSKFARSK